jgi:Methyltransferase domain
MSVRWFDRTTLDRTIGNHIARVDVVLDIGSGIRPQAFFRPRVHICCEPYEEYVQVLQSRFAANPNLVILQGTWQDVMKTIPARSVDSVFLIDLIEHLDKEEGHALLAECHRVARKQIILFTPLGFAKQDYELGDADGWGMHGSGWQVHKSGWTPEDFDTAWNIFASKLYHTVNGKGEQFDPPFGAFWAIKNLESSASKRWYGVRETGHHLVDRGCDKAFYGAIMIRDLPRRVTRAQLGYRVRRVLRHG